MADQWARDLVMNSGVRLAALTVELLARTWASVWEARMAESMECPTDVNLEKLKVQRRDGWMDIPLVDVKGYSKELIKVGW